MIKGLVAGGLAIVITLAAALVMGRVLVVVLNAAVP